MKVLLTEQSDQLKRVGQVNNQNHEFIKKLKIVMDSLMQKFERVIEPSKQPTKELEVLQAQIRERAAE